MESRYGVRPARWIDTGERFHVVTIDGCPVAVEPDDLALECYAQEHNMVLVTEQFLRDLQRMANRNE